MTKKRIAIILGSVLGVVAAALVLAGVLQHGGTARADPGTVITTVAIDMNPYATPANDDDEVGTIERCVRVSGVAGTTFDVDVVLDAIPAFGGGRPDDFYAFFYDLNFPHAQVEVSSHTHEVSGTNLIERAPGSSTQDMSDGTPDTTSPHAVMLVEWGTAETGNGGVLGRYEFQVLPGASAGLYSLTLSAVAIGDSSGLGIWDNPGNGTDDDSDTSTDEDILLDGSSAPVAYGWIAIDTPCPGIFAPPLKYEKVSMPDFGQHSKSWCWVGAAANSFWWFAKTGDYPGLVPAGYEYIEPLSRNALGADNYDPHDVDGDTITNEPDGVPDFFDYNDRPENTGAVYDGTCGDFLDNDGPDGLVDFTGLINPLAPRPPDPDCTSFVAPLGDDDSDGSVDEDPINGGVDEDGDGSVDEDPINGLDDDGDGPYGGPGQPCPGPGNPGCDEDPPAYDDDGNNGADEDGVVGYRTLLKKIADYTWHDTNEDGIDDGPAGPDGVPGNWDDEPPYVYSEPVDKWDYLCGLQNYIDDHGANLKVHDLIHPNFVNKGITPVTDENRGAMIGKRPGLMPQAAQNNCGITQRVKTPTLTDYKWELSRSQDVLVWMCTLNAQTDWYCHVVTGQAYDTTVGGQYGNGTITVADPWTHSAVHDDSWLNQGNGPDHNNDYKHPDPEPYDTCDVKTPGKDDNSQNFDIDCSGTVWTVVDLIFISPPGPDVKVVDWTAPSPVDLTTSGDSVAILVQEVKHNNGPMSTFASATWTAIPSDPMAINVKWVAQPGDICTWEGVQVDCASPTITDLEFEVDLPVSITVSPSRYLELEGIIPGQYEVTLINDEWPFNPDPPYGPGTDPDPTNNVATTTIYVNVAQTPGFVDKEVLSVTFDDALSYPAEGTELSPPNELTVKESENVAVSVTSEDINYGPNEPEDTEISFYLIVPEDCSARWYDPQNNFPADIPTIGGDIYVGSSGMPWYPEFKEPGPVILDLHFQTLEYGLTEPVTPPADPQRYTRFFELHCYEPGDQVFTVCNRADPKWDEDLKPANNLLCEDLTVHVQAEADKEVLEIRFDEADNYPGEGTPIQGPPYEYTLPASENRQISVTSVDVNHGPGTPDDTEISFYAFVPDGCEGQFQDPGGLLFADVYTLDGDYLVGSSGTTVFTQDKVPGPRWVDVHFQTLEYGLDEPVAIDQYYTRYFGLHCFEPGDYVFQFCNRADPKSPYEDPGVYPNYLCETLTVHAEAPEGVDLEKVDLYVKPFYCGDSDLDGLEDGGAAGGTIPGTGNCCDGVDNDGDTNIDGRDSDCVPYINEDDVDWIDDDLDGLLNEDPPSYPSEPQTCPWNGDDDCDGEVDEDPKNDFDDDGDGLVDEDPANGFLGIDNDHDGYVDEDGSGRFDWDGDTTIDEVQLEGVDDDGDTMVDEDPLDSPIKRGAEVADPEVKWVQLPDLFETGGDVNATYGYILANDFLCDETGYITQIDFWGSWLYDFMPYGDPAAVSFTLSIHDDDPVGPGWSQPKNLLWLYTFAPGECVPTIWAEPVPEGWMEPPDWWEPFADSVAWLYSCPIPEGAWFYQEEGNVYWLDIQAYPLEEGRYFGWKTSETFWNDDAVWQWAEEPYQGDWWELRYPETHPWYPESIDLAFQIWGQAEATPPVIHEPHYLIKEVLRNLGPETVWAEDTKEIDAPAWRADALEDGLTTCNDGLDNDLDTYCDTIPDFCWPGSEPDPECLDEHIGEEESGLHSCNDGLDNGQADGLIDELDDDCETLTEVSVECADPDDFITVKEDVPWYIKPPSTDDILLDYPECAQYHDPTGGHFSKCVPCKIPMGVGPVNDTCDNLLTGGFSPGYCIAVDSVPGVYKELDLHLQVELPSDVLVTQEHQFDLSCEGPIGQHKFIIQNEIQPVEGIDPNQDNNELEMELLVECVPACSPGIDSDGDGWNDGLECYVGTDPSDPCPDIVGVHDAIPSDNNMDKKVNVLDLLNYKPKLLGPFDQRYDLVPDGKINVLDLLVYKPELLKPWPCT